MLEQTTVTNSIRRTMDEDKERIRRIRRRENEEQSQEERESEAFDNFRYDYKMAERSKN